MDRALLSIVLSLSYFLGAHSALLGQEHRHTEDAYSKELGSVSFPVSCNPAVQPLFERGVALLHSFGYSAAQRQFQQIEHTDPKCAMAFWGDAMSLYRQLWDRPSASVLKTGWSLVQKAQAAGPLSGREHGYIEAAAAFYRDDPHMTYEARWSDYMRVMEKLHHDYPDDHEAAAFYALSLIASPHSNDNDLAYRKKAVMILNALLAREPNHPGVAHYLIHACDSPEMASEGLPAARRYAQIAPASAHALHMPSHIFARLGLWQDDIASNLKSKSSAEQQSLQAERLHAMSFLEYAYLQLGQDNEAAATEAEALKVRKDEFGSEMEDYFYRVQVNFPSLLLLETHAWEKAESLEPPHGAAADFQARVYWTQAVAAGHLKDTAVAKAAVRHYDDALQAVRHSSYPYVADQMTDARDQAHAWAAFAEGNGAEAMQLLQAVADSQDKAGKGEVEIPAREMLADMLLALNRPQQALAQYILSLKTDPNRFNSLYGAGYAAELSHQATIAHHFYQQLLSNCKDATGSSRAELAHAQAYLHAPNTLDRGGC